MSEYEAVHSIDRQESNLGIVAQFGLVDENVPKSLRESVIRCSNQVRNER